MELSVASLTNDEEIKPYRIHVSTKYLDLTKKKLELTRLPHELLLPPAREWENGTPKSQVEPLIDFWLEQYSWRTQESRLNELPQFRTAIKIRGENVPLRIHFLHFKSPYRSAVPLLLIPSFPLTNLSLIPLFKPLTDDPEHPFHLIVPSIPGLGFSDAFSAGGNVLEGTAELFNILMKRLGYEYYIASSTGAVPTVDYQLARLIGEKWGDNCVGTNLISPPLERPRFGKDPLSWGKFVTARFFHAGIWGYDEQDWAPLREAEKAAKKPRAEETQLLRRLSHGAVGIVGLREPNTLAYALCDSPVGLLSLVCSALRRDSPQHTLDSEAIIDVTQLSWLPGPEAAMRLWASASAEAEKLPKLKKSRASVTLFGVDGDAYVCPAWGWEQHDIVSTHRAAGKPGLLVFERPEIIVSGIQALATEVKKRDRRLRVEASEETVMGPTAEAEPAILEDIEDTGDDHELQLVVESPSTVDTVIAVPKL